MSISFCKSLILGWSIMVITTSALAQSDNEGKLVFEWQQKPVVSPSSIVMANPDGSDSKVIAPHGVNPLWFPQRDKVAYFVSNKKVSDRDYFSDGNTLISDLTGNVLKTIPYCVEDISPDGKKLLVTPPHRNEHGNREVGVYDLTTDKYTSLLTPADFPNESQRIAPYGAKWLAGNDKIVFFIVTEIGILTSRFGLMSVSDRNIRLFNLPEDVLVESPWFDVSEKGDKIVFVGWPKTEYLEKGKRGIYVFDLKRNTIRLVHREPHPVAIQGVVWSPSEEKILFDINIFGSSSIEHDLKIVNADGSFPHRIYSVNKLHEMWNAFGGTFDVWRSTPDWR